MRQQRRAPLPKIPALSRKYSLCRWFGRLRLAPLRFHGFTTCIFHLSPCFWKAGVVQIIGLDANRLASLLPFSGVAGVIAFGVLATRATWRKHLLWVSCAVVILGSNAFFFGEGTMTKAALLVAGFGLSGFLPVLNTYIMSLPSMTPSLVAAFVVVVNMAIYLAGFISPLAVGWVSQTSFGLRNTLALFSWIELVAIFMFMRLPTTASVDVSDP